jgi:predicted  nucleic acid-binding Zn-ribbon protein
MINKYNAETTQYVTFCDGVNSKIKKDFSDIKEIVYDKINFILKEYNQTSEKLENEHISLKNEIDFLQKENEELLVKIVALKEKIAKMEKIIGHQLENRNGKFKTK